MAKHDELIIENVTMGVGASKSRTRSGLAQLKTPRKKPSIEPKNWHPKETSS